MCPNAAPSANSIPFLLAPVIALTLQPTLAVQQSLSGKMCDLVPIRQTVQGLLMVRPFRSVTDLLHNIEDKTFQQTDTTNFRTTHRMSLERPHSV